MNLKKKLASGEFLILAEMEPPKGVDFSSVIAPATRVKGKVDAFVVPEMSNAVLKMSSLGGCALLQSRGLETVMQVCCRDRNRLALQADLLAAHALGITNVMAITGVDPSYGDHHRARSVHDIDLLQLLEVIQTLQTGRDMAGVELNCGPTFCVGSTVTTGISGELLDHELEELDKKIAAGAEFFITQPVFALQALEGFMAKMGERKAGIIPTVLLLKSVGMARYIDQHLDHVQVPSDLILRIQKAPDKVRECVQIAGELVATIRRNGFSGVLISTIGWEDKLPGILEV
ncbi:MAG TPA: methylenetetrahydrofolate reductase [Syntrophobacteraceae bacterium]|nr:methylenetetrahydrofolate reductase [Syntrophobacteraceae bacterium]